MRVDWSGLIFTHCLPGPHLRCVHLQSVIVRGRVQAAGVLREAYRNEALFRWLLGDVRKDVKGKEKEESLLQWLVDWVGPCAVSLRQSPGVAIFLCLCPGAAYGGTPLYVVLAAYGGTPLYVVLWLGTTTSHAHARTRTRQRLSRSWRYSHCLAIPHRAMRHGGGGDGHADDGSAPPLPRGCVVVESPGADLL